MNEIACVLCCETAEAFYRLFRAADEDFDQLCFEYGIELDDVVSNLTYDVKVGVRWENGLAVRVACP